MRGWEILKSKYNVHELKQFHTYMFEIIYPENRIVVDYGKTTDVVMLGVIHTKSGDEIERHIVEKDYNEHFRLVVDYNIKDSWDHLGSSNIPNREGYVIRFDSGFRMKIKFQEYVRLHRIITQVSNTSIWEMLKSGMPLEMILEDVPDEFYYWVRKVESELREAYANVMGKAFKKWEEIYNELGPNASRLEWVDYVSAEGKQMSSLLFCIYDLNMEKMNSFIWKHIKPSWEKPFFRI
jgi:RNA ligase